MLFKAIIEKYFDFCDKIDGKYQCSCASIQKWPSFKLIFEGVATSLHPKSYLVRTNGYCTFAFGSIENSYDQILLGDPFFRQYIVVFDQENGKVGFKGETEDIQLIGAGLWVNIHYGMLVLLLMQLIFAIYILAYFRLNKVTTKQKSPSS